MNIERVAQELASDLVLTRPLVCIDLEATGVMLGRDRIVQIATATVLPDGAVTTWQSLVNPEMPIPAETTAVHGITDAMVTSAPTFAQVPPNPNRPPSLSAGADLTSAPGAIAVLSADAADPDGDPLEFSWVQTAGPVVALTGASTAAASFVAPPAGPSGEVLAFTVTVRDGLGGQAQDALVVRVQRNDQAPSCGTARPSRTSLWPVNGRMHEISILGVRSPDDSPVAITVDSTC